VLLRLRAESKRNEDTSAHFQLLSWTIRKRVCAEGFLSSWLWWV